VEGQKDSLLYKRTICIKVPEEKKLGLRVHFIPQDVSPETTKGIWFCPEPLLRVDLKFGAWKTY